MTVSQTVDKGSTPLSTAWWGIMLRLQTSTEVRILLSTFIPHAPVAQSADAPDLKSGNSAGSMPAGGTDGSAYWYGQFAWKADVP